jgi:tetratricopeptide (TPR) repeat protein
MSSERPFLSHFSPQWTNPQYLEDILVQRGDLLAESVAAVRDSVLTDRRHHLLFIGPRGAGKTHLVTLIQHRLSQDAALTDCMRVAWLNEDETATSFLRLLIAIYRSLSERYPEEFPAETITKLAGQDPGVAVEQLTRDLLRDLDGRIIVCLMENLDSLFRSLNVAEQRNWRAFLQNHPVIVTVGTAQALFDGIADHDDPFFGFFDTRHLQPLSVDEARDLLERIATLHGRTDLAEFLRTPTGRARVDAIRALAGGNPRLYLIFSDLLVNAAALDDLVRPFEEMVDRQLTSYYQERLRWLSPQQREIVQFLCRAGSPVPVKHIAEGLFTTHNSITGQLKQLREFRYVDSHPLGREVLYELAEPLMRLALQVKETHDRRPLALIVDFLRIWHEQQELADRLAQCPADSPARAYLENAHRLMLTGPNLRHELFRRDLDLAGPELSDEIALEKARSVANSGQAADLIRLGRILNDREDWEEAIRIFTRVIEQKDATPSQVARALYRRGYAHYHTGRPEQDIADCTRAIDLPGAPPEQVAMALFYRGITHEETGRSGEAIADYSRAIELPGASPEPVAMALVNRSSKHGEAGRTAEAIADCTRAIELPGAPPEPVAMALVHRGYWHGESKRTAKAIADYTRAIELPGAPPERVAMALFYRGITHGKIGRTAEEIADYTRAIDLPRALPTQVVEALNNRAVCHANQGQHEAVLRDLGQLFTLPDEKAAREVLSSRLHYKARQVVDAVFAVTTDGARWLSLLTEFAGHFARFGGLTQLGEAAVKQLPAVAASPLNHAAWDAWVEAWEAARAALPAQDRDQLDIPLRLLRTGIAWLKSQDDAHLLTLPREERRILRQALTLPAGKP